jgi:outer membrane receptor protein involved in Fe transport
VRSSQLSLSALLVSVVLACALPAAARAQLHAEARVARPITATNAEDPTAAGTAIETQGRSAARESVSDVLLEVPGARPIRSGWLASFTSASLRGAEGEHTVVLLGDIALSSADASLFDLSTVPLELLERVTVYRGGAPVWLGQGAIGGVVQLEPARARRSSLAVTGTAGSFGTFGASMRAQVSDGADEPSLLGAAGALGSSGDFSYAYDGKTSFDTTDDRVMRRKNADFLDGHALLRLEQPLGPGALELLMLGFSRVGGEPGAPKDPVLRAHRGFTRGVVGLGYTYEQVAQGERSLRLQGIGALHFTRSQLTDLYAEIGSSGADAQDDRSLSASARLAASAAVAPMLELTVVANAARDSHAPSDRFELTPLPTSSRVTLAGALEAHLHGRVLGMPAALRGSLRAESVTAELHRERFNTVRAAEASEFLPTYRAAAALEALPGLALSASVASGARAPSTLELFGDGVFILGNIGLSPEESVSIDAGLVHNAQLD